MVVVSTGLIEDRMGFGTKNWDFDSVLLVSLADIRPGQKRPAVNSRF
jgi:hypothetical protein